MVLIGFGDRTMSENKRLPFVVEKPAKNRRYKLITIQGKHYLMDSDIPIIMTIIFPLLSYFFKHVCVEITKEEYARIFNFADNPDSNKFTKVTITAGSVGMIGYTGSQGLYDDTRFLEFNNLSIKIGLYIAGLLGCVIYKIIYHKRHQLDEIMLDQSRKRIVIKRIYPAEYYFLPKIGLYIVLVFFLYGMLYAETTIQTVNVIIMSMPVFCFAILLFFNENMWGFENGELILEDKEST